LDHSVSLYISDRSNAEITHSTMIFTAFKQNPAHDQNQGKRHGDREYVIILQR